MDIEALRGFVAVCEEKKISNAAEKLFMSKQALSNIIRKMEEEMDAVFFIRTHAGVEMTPAGELFYQQARQMLEQWETVTKKLSSISHPQRKSLRVGFGYMCFNLWTHETEAAYAKAHPEIDLHVGSDVSKTLLAQLDAGQIDLMITCLCMENQPGYTSRLLWERRMMLMIPKEDPLAACAEIYPEQLQGRMVLYVDSGAVYMQRFCRFMEARGIGFTPGEVRAGNFLSNLRVTQEEGAVLLTNGMYSLVMANVDGYACRPLVCGDAVPMSGIYALTLNETGERPEIRSFSDFLVGKMAELWPEN